MLRSNEQLRLFEGERADRREHSRDLKPRPPLSVAGLFAGIGGIETGLSHAGHETNLLCEVDDAAAEVLRSRTLASKFESDVRRIHRLPSSTSLVAAGFPCQDLSQAGKTEGIAGARSGLVGEVFRLVKDQRVPWILIENVSFMLQLARGRALEVIVQTLESLGYKWAYRVVDSRAFGVPQRRQRVFLIAALDDDPRAVLLSDDAGEPETISSDDWRKHACGFYWTEGIRGLGWALNAVPTLKGGSTIGIPSPPAIVLPQGSVVKPHIRDAERLQGFDAGWTEPAERVGRSGFRWKLVGNAVTVGASAWIGERLRRPREYDASNDVRLRRSASWPKAAWNLDGHVDGRRASNVSAWPTHIPYEPLDRFLQHESEPLSLRATRGFFQRATSPRCNLRFPAGFLELIDAHIDKMARATAN